MHDWSAADELTATCAADWLSRDRRHAGTSAPPAPIQTPENTADNEPSNRLVTHPLPALAERAFIGRGTVRARR